MKLYLVRHGKVAAPDSIRYADGDRALSDDGVEEIAALASWMASKHIKPQILLHSPLLRTTQTAEIIAGQIGAIAEPWPRLAEDIDGESWGQVLRERLGNAGSAMLVGHQPGLMSVLSELLSSTPFSFELSRGALAEVAVQSFEPKLRGVLVSLLQPALLEGRDSSR